MSDDQRKAEQFRKVIGQAIIDGLLEVKSDGQLAFIVPGGPEEPHPEGTYYMGVDGGVFKKSYIK
jgi:hypothetical protein